MYVMLMSEVHQRLRVITNALVVSCQGRHSRVHHACLFVCGLEVEPPTVARSVVLIRGGIQHLLEFSAI